MCACCADAPFELSRCVSDAIALVVHEETKKVSKDDRDRQLLTHELNDLYSPESAEGTSILLIIARSTSLISPVISRSWIHGSVVIVWEVVVRVGKAIKCSTISLNLRTCVAC